ncbi:helix-turn-helix domain-containing protein [Nocardia sp. KC 131]
MLHIHTNTVDYRLKRIGQITGHNATEGMGLWYLRSALNARGFR